MGTLLTNNTTHGNTRLKAFYDAADFIVAGDSCAPEEKLHFFITAHFSKAKQIDVHKCCAHFRNCMDRKILGRSGVRLYKALWLEEGEQLRSKMGNTTHAHWLFEWPDETLSDKAFEHVFIELWSDICGSENIDFKLVRPELGGIHGLINYCVKESDIGNTGVFIEHCSDNARDQRSRQALRKKQR